MRLMASAACLRVPAVEIERCSLLGRRLYLQSAIYRFSAPPRPRDVVVVQINPVARESEPHFRAGNHEPGQRDHVQLLADRRISRHRIRPAADRRGIAEGGTGTGEYRRINVHRIDLGFIGRNFRRRAGSTPISISSRCCIAPAAAPGGGFLDRTSATSVCAAPSICASRCAPSGDDEMRPVSTGSRRSTGTAGAACARLPAISRRSFSATGRVCPARHCRCRHHDAGARRHRQRGQHVALGRRGVDGAIHRAADRAGRRMPDASGLQDRLGQDHARLPAAGAQRSSIAVGPVWQGGGSGEDDLLASCYSTALALAFERRLRSVALPRSRPAFYGFRPTPRRGSRSGPLMSEVEAEPRGLEARGFCCFSEESAITTSMRLASTDWRVPR